MKTATEFKHIFHCLASWSTKTVCKSRVVLLKHYEDWVSSDVNKRIVSLILKPVDDQMCYIFTGWFLCEDLSIDIIKHKRVCSFNRWEDQLIIFIITGIHGPVRTSEKIIWVIFVHVINDLLSAVISSLPLKVITNYS